MKSPENLFGNPFDDEKIIPARLSQFTGDLINRLIQANGDGDYTVLIALLTGLWNPFKAEIDDVDSSLNRQVGKTMTNDEVMAEFQKTMSKKQGVIAEALGGDNTPAYMEFYPHGLNEYSKATKLQMPTLVARIFKAANDHSAALGGPLSALLKGYQPLWTNSRDDQQKQMGDVSDNRADRSAFRTPLELGLVTTLHTIGAKFPGDVTACKQFFDFSLLYHATHHKHEKLTLTIAPGAIAMVTNRLYTDSNRIHVGNLSDNANLHAYLAAAINAQPNGKGIEVKASHGANALPSKYGDLNDAYFLIKNLSDVNELTCEVEITS